jgi:hypothetical protein
MLTGAGKTFTWDIDNRVTTINTPGVGTTLFEYDYTGTRTEKAAPASGGSTIFPFQGYEIAPNGTMTKFIRIGIEVNSSGLRKDLDGVVTVASPNAIRGEIIAVDGENLACLERLRGNDQGGVGEVHRMVRILFHQLKSPLEPGAVHKPGRQSAPEDEIPKAVGSFASRREHMEGLGQDGDRRGQRLANGLQQFLAALVLTVLGIE